jgi:hypothetical protein
VSKLCRCPLRPVTHELTVDCDPKPDQVFEIEAPPARLLTDKEFRYVKSGDTDLAKTFARVRRENKKREVKCAATVTTLQVKKA